MLWPTTTVTVFRASTQVDEWEDVRDDNLTPLYSDIPAAVVENSQNRYGQNDLRDEMVQQYTVRVPGCYEILEGDRLKDACTGSWYLVDGVSAPQPFVMATSTRLTTQKIGAGP